MRLPAGAVRLALGTLSPLLVQSRTSVEVAAALLPTGGSARADVVGGVPGERHGAPGSRALLYLHGGGFNLGSPRTHRALVARLAEALEATAFVPAYRLAPEHPHPAALDDVHAAYLGLRAEAEEVVVAGDSAGGGLALALALRLRDQGVALPAALALICPWLDLGAERDHTGDPLLTPGALRRWARHYGGDPDDPSVSPLRADLDGLPPIVVHSAGDDPLLGDAEALPAAEHRRHPGMWHAFHVLAGVLSEADEAVDALGRSLRVQVGLDRRPPRVAIVGAGMSGICMAAKLRAAGLEDFTLHEKAGEVGGTWRENTYPGLSCDVPARFYSFSFAPNPDWSSSFAPGPEIQEYFVRTSERLGLRGHIRFGSEVVSARWDGVAWELATADGAGDRADVLVTATGVLHHPKLPDLEGLSDFAGAAFHSARWDHGVALEGRRVGVIGNGSTGAQIVGELAGRTGSLTLFQRTPQWVLPVPNLPYPGPVRALMRAVPPLNRRAYRSYQVALESILSPATLHEGWQRSVIAGACRLNLQLNVRDPELRERLRPAYEPMCKRLIMSSRFYPALGREGVSLVTERIDRVEPEGVRTADGRLHELDVLVFATGFDAHAYVRPMAITGQDGVTLEDAWAATPRAYRTVAVPGFPNLFMLMGPHSPVGNHSLIAVAETQADYVLRWIECLRDGQLRSVAPKEQATEAYYEAVREALPGTVWATGCESWYLDAEGRPALWPWSPARHRAMLREPAVEDFELA